MSESPSEEAVRRGVLVYVVIQERAVRRRAEAEAVEARQAEILTKFRPLVREAAAAFKTDVHYAVDIARAGRFHIERQERAQALQEAV